MDLLEIDHVTKTIGGKSIIDSISFSANPGEIIAVIGPNGAGKSTLLKLIYGLLKPDQGIITYNKKDVFSDLNEIHSEIGSLIEEPYLYPYLTAEEQLDICLKLHRNKSSQLYSVVLDQLEIGSFKNTKIRNYSMGMKQRLGIACAVIHDPQLIILDEPTNSVDVNGVRAIKDLIGELKKINKTILISSHLIKEVEEICDRALFLDKGKVIKEYNSDQIKETYKIYIGIEENKMIPKHIRENYNINETQEHLIISVPDSELNEVLKQCVSSNIDILKIDRQRLGLEDAFFA